MRETLEAWSGGITVAGKNLQLKILERYDPHSTSKRINNRTPETSRTRKQQNRLKD